jgi:hypothetical protein
LFQKHLLTLPRTPKTKLPITPSVKGEKGRQDVVLSMEENGEKCNIKSKESKEELTHEHA